MWRVKLTRRYRYIAGPRRQVACKAKVKSGLLPVASSHALRSGVLGDGYLAGGVVFRPFFLFLSPIPFLIFFSLYVSPPEKVLRVSVIYRSPRKRYKSVWPSAKETDIFLKQKQRAQYVQDRDVYYYLVYIYMYINKL